MTDHYREIPAARKGDPELASLLARGEEVQALQRSSSKQTSKAEDRAAMRLALAVGAHLRPRRVRVIYRLSLAAVALAVLAPLALLAAFTSLWVALISSLVVAGGPGIAVWIFLPACRRAAHSAFGVVASSHEVAAEESWTQTLPFVLDGYFDVVRQGSLSDRHDAFVAQIAWRDPPPPSNLLGQALAGTTMKHVTTSAERVLFVHEDVFSVTAVHEACDFFAVFDRTYPIDRITPRRIRPPDPG